MASTTVNFFGSSLQRSDLPKYQWNLVLLDLAEAATGFSKEIQGGSAFAALLRDLATTDAFSDADAAMQAALAFAKRARKIVFPHDHDREKEIFSSFSKLAVKAVQKSWWRPASTPSAVDHASNPHEGGSGGTAEEEGVEPVAAVVESPEPEVQVTRPMDRFQSSIPPVGSAADSAVSHRQRLPTDDSDSASHEVQAAFDEVKEQLAGSAAEMLRPAAQRVSSDHTRGAHATSGKGGVPQTSASQGISGSSRLVGAAKRSARGTGALFESSSTIGASTSPSKSGRHSAPPATHVPATSGGSAASVGHAVNFDDAVEPFDDVIYSDMSPHGDAINYHGSRRDAVGLFSDAGFERRAPDADLERRSVDAELSEDLGLQGLLDAARDEFDEIGDVYGRAEPHRQEARGRPRPTTRVPLASPEPGDATPMRVDSRLTPRVQSAPARESRVSFVEADDDDEVGGATAVRGGDSIDAILGGVNSADARNAWERRLLEIFDGVSSAGLPAGLAAAVRDEFEQLDLNRVVPERDRSLLAIRKLFTQPAAAICRLLSVVPVDALKSKHSKLLRDSESKRDLLFSLLVNKVLVDVDDETLDDWFEGDSNASARFVRLWATAPIRILAEDLRNLTYERSLLSVKAQQSRNILHQLRDERSVLHDRHFVDSLRTADRLARVTAGATASTADSSTSRARDRDGSDSSDSESSRGRRGRSRSRSRSRRDFRPRSGGGGSGGGGGGARQQVRTQDRGRGRGDWRSRSPRAREQSRGRGAGGYSKEGGQRFQAGGAGEVKYAGGSGAQRQQQGNYKGAARQSRG
jgi:uncharacterized membrane protein YgcG